MFLVSPPRGITFNAKTASLTGHADVASKVAQPRKGKKNIMPTKIKQPANYSGTQTSPKPAAGWSAFRCGTQPSPAPRSYIRKPENRNSRRTTTERGPHASAHTANHLSQSWPAFRRGTLTSPATDVAVAQLPVSETYPKYVTTYTEINT